MTNYLNSCKVSAIEAFLPAIGENKNDRNPLSLVSLGQLFKIWRQRAQQRHALAQLNDHQLTDIGISKQTALLEANKPFWLT